MVQVIEGRILIIEMILAVELAVGSGYGGFELTRVKLMKCLKEYQGNSHFVCVCARDEGEDEIFLILCSRCALTSVILAGKRDICHHSTVGVSENVVVVETSYRLL